MIVRRKFAIPDLPDPWLEREAVAETLRKGLEARYRLTLVLAGAGMGKTAALSAYVRRPPVVPNEAPALAAWYGLGRTDGDPAVFMPHLVGTLSQAVPELSDQAERIFGALGAAGLAQAAGVLCDDLDAALAGRRLILVLDDCQHLPGGDAAAGALEALIRYFPDSCQLVLAGRALPQVKLSRFEIRDQVLAIRDPALRFDDGELRTLAGASEAGRLAERTHGWPAGVMHALRRGRPDDPGDRDLLHGYIGEEVLDGMAREPMQDLAELALSEEASVAACEALLGRARLEALLEHPALAGFMARQGDHIVLQPILREAVGNRVEQTWPRAERETLCRRLAGCAGDPVLAVSLLLRAQAWDDAERHLVETFPVLAAAGRLASVRTLLAQFGAKRMVTPALLLVLGELERREGRFREALVLFEDALRAEPESAALQGRICAGLAAVYGVRGEVEKQRDHAERALAWLPPDDTSAVASCRSILGMAHAYRFDLASARREFEQALAGFLDAGDVTGQIKVQHNLGFAHSRVGDFRRAIAHYQEALRLAQASGQLPLAVTYSNLALAEVYLDRLEEAQAHLEQGVALAERLEALRDKAVMLRTLGRLLMRRGDRGEAEAAYDRALDLANQIGDRNTQIYASIGRAEVDLERGDAHAAAIRAEQAAAAANSAPGDPAATDCTLVIARIALALGNTGEADRHLQALDAAQALSPSTYLEFLHAGLAADLAESQGDRDAARRWNDRAAKLSADFGYPPRPAPAARPATRGARAGSREAPAVPTAPALDVRALGTFEVSVAGAATGPAAWSIAKTRVMLAYLLAHPGGATKEALLELLFPDEDPARTAVNMVLARLRHALEPGNPPGTPSRYVLFQSGKYLLNQGLVTRFDVSVFREHLREAQRPGLPAAELEERLASAVGAYRGPFLDGLAGLPWVEMEREGLRRAMAGAFTELLALAAARDDWKMLETAARELLERDPFSQEGHRAAVLALALQDRTDDAVRASAAAKAFLENGPHAVLEPATAELFDLVQEDRLTMRSARALLSAS